MKKYLHCLIALVSLSAFAQNFQGVAVYESKTTLDLDNSEESQEGEQLPPEIEAQINEQLKKAFEKTYTLEFDKTASLYKEQEKLDKPATGDHITIAVNFSGGEGTQYKNLKDKTSVTESEIFGKEFLIMDSIPKTDWKLGTETKKIGNYTCYKATSVIKPKETTNGDKAIALTDGPLKDIIVTAWYTPEIPVSHGPGNYGGLPGLILEVNDGQTTLLCSKITLNPKEKLVIKAPKKGSKVTRAEYDKIMDEKTKEMMEMDGEPSAPGTSKTTRVIRIGG
jgi:GLPGLI family protein